MNFGIILKLMGIIGKLKDLVSSVGKLSSLFHEVSSDPSLKAELAKCPVLTKDVADISQKIRTVQNSAGFVISDKNLKSKYDEVNRLIGYIKVLISAFTADTADTAALEELSHSVLLQGWMEKVAFEWQSIQGSLEGFKL